MTVNLKTIRKWKLGGNDQIKDYFKITNKINK